jgi:sulfatase maturation enzyme AslB (radical SAM superfamily)
MNKDKNKLLNDSKYFCILPWIHIHGWADGNSYPCCNANTSAPVGNMRKNTIEEIWNDHDMREMRRNMLNEQPCRQCEKCYEQEKNELISMRKEMNRNFGNLIDTLDTTEQDGSADFKIHYWDVRFSNLCNFSCRSCGPGFSSNWYNEHVKMYGKPPDSQGRVLDRIEYAAGDEDSMIEQMLPHIPYLQQVYFAGGEPLLMREHYFMLEKLIEAGRTDVRLQYNTNFSELKYKNKSVIDYWKKFSNISIGASLDGMGDRAEIIRNGTDWNKILDNLRLVKEQLPGIHLYINCTLSVMNVLHILDFHRAMVEQKIINVGDFNVNVCFQPAWLRIDILPWDFKNNSVIPRYLEHIEWVKSQDPSYRSERTVSGFLGAVNMMQGTDASSMFPKFISSTALHDKAKNQDFWKTFPELLEIKNAIT